MNPLLRSTIALPKRWSTSWPLSRNETASSSLPLTTRASRSAAPTASPWREWPHEGELVKARDAVVEGWRNLRSGTGRPIAVALALTLCGATLLGLEVSSVAQLVTRAHTFQDAGGSTLILESGGQVDAAACARLGSLTVGEGAAAVTLGSRTVHPAMLPQQAVPLIRATAGLADILGAHPDGPGLWLSAEAADNLGLRVGSALVLDGQPTRVAAVYAYPEDGRRPGLGYAVIDPVPSGGAFDECWVRSWPTDDGVLPALTATAFHPSTEQSQRRFSQLNGTLGTTCLLYTSRCV